MGFTLTDRLLHRLRKAKEGGVVLLMNYLINLSEESDHFLRQLCDPDRSPHSEAVSVEDFLSAFVEEQLDELFIRRERRKTKKDKKLDDAVRSAKGRAKG